MSCVVVPACIIFVCAAGHVAQLVTSSWPDVNSPVCRGGVGRVSLDSLQQFKASAHHQILAD